MSDLTGPAGGEWVLSEAIARGDIYMRCTQCGRITQKAWRYFVGAMSYACVCTDCIPTDDDTDDNNEEVTMTSTAGITPDVLAEIALALEAAHEDWAQGRATSPDTHDYVLIAERVLEDRIGPEHLWLSDDDTSLREAVATRESVAEAMYELQCDGKLQEWPEMAEWLSGMVTVGPDADDFPSGERS